MELPIHYQELENIYANTLGRGLRSLAVCAAEPGEGVSTVAYALARRSEAGGRRTLLVELNLFRPRLAAQLGVAAADWAAASSLSAPLLDPAASGRLAFLPAPPTSTGLLTLRERGTLAGYIASWGQQFDAVVIDTSAVNAVNQGNVPADIVCAGCEGTLLVVLAGRTRAAAVARACETLAASGARLAGAVLNDQFNPSLAQELLRESRRLDRYCPRIMAALRAVIRRSALLNLQA
jgi:Mrp family chromosome partitioning ATPase